MTSAIAPPTPASTSSNTYVPGRALVGQDALEREQRPRQLAAARDPAQRARLLAAVRRDEELDAVDARAREPRAVDEQRVARRCRRRDVDDDPRAPHAELRRARARWRRPSLSAASRRLRESARAAAPASRDAARLLGLELRDALRRAGQRRRARARAPPRCARSSAVVGPVLPQELLQAEERAPRPRRGAPGSPRRPRRSARARAPRRRARPAPTRRCARAARASRRCAAACSSSAARRASSSQMAALPLVEALGRAARRRLQLLGVPQPGALVLELRLLAVARVELVDLAELPARGSPRARPGPAPGARAASSSRTTRPARRPRSATRAALGLEPAERVEVLDVGRRVGQRHALVLRGDVAEVRRDLGELRGRAEPPVDVGAAPRPLAPGRRAGRRARARTGSPPPRAWRRPATPARARRGPRPRPPSAPPARAPGRARPPRTSDKRVDEHRLAGARSRP